VEQSIMHTPPPSFHRAAWRGEQGLQAVKSVAAFLTQFPPEEQKLSWKYFQLCRFSSIEYAYTPAGIRPVLKR
jgi:hypothetical protein